MMEISPFPTLSSFPILSSFEDLSQTYPTPYPELPTLSPLETSPLKKRRGEGEDSDNSESIMFKDFLANVLRLGDEDLKEDWLIPFLQDDNREDSTVVLNSNDNNTENQLHNQPVGAEAVAPITPTPAPAVAAPAPAKPRNNKRPRNAATAVGSSVPAPTTNRRLWVKDRSKDWWEKCNQPDYPEEEFKKAFRMSKATFNMLVEELEATVTRKDTALRTAIPVHQRVAVCIWRLATGEPLREVSKRFGLGISTCHKLVLEVCAAIKALLMDKFLLWPDEAKMSHIKAEFEAMSGIPNVAGSVYTTHVPIIAPKGNVATYFNKRHTDRNQKTSYTITLQGVVDPKGIFTDICIGWPGSYTDDKILEQSSLANRVKSGLALKEGWVVGNSNHPLLDWCMVPYTSQNQTWTQHTFNDKVEVIQKVARNAFYKLKKRWACLQKRTEVKLDEVPVVLGACCILHNICEMRREEIIVPDPDNSFELFDDTVLPENIIKSIPAVQARDHIAHNLLHHGIVN